MNYIKVTIRIESETGFIADVLSACLAEVGFDSFEETSRGINAYCPESLYSDAALSDAIQETENAYRCRISFRREVIEEQNWNATWEQNSFEPITVADQIAIYPTSRRNDFVGQSYPYKIELNPTQAFGSGYHETTQMMLRYLLDINLCDRSLLDMGCGTAVLAILARLRGATPVYAIDIDHWSADNAISNCALNRLTDVSVVLGDASTIEQTRTKFSVILANINRNILIADMHRYVASLMSGGTLIMSGFYCDDLPIIDDAAKALNLCRIDIKTANNWVAVRYQLNVSV